MNLLSKGALLIVCLFWQSVSVAISVTDDEGNTVELPLPARRIISLAPHITENLFAAGAGPHIVGAVEYSDFPKDATKIPRVGAANALDLEMIIGLKPDLVVVWGSGSLRDHVKKMRDLGLVVFVSEPQRMEDIPRTIERFGILAGTGSLSENAADRFRTRQLQLKARYTKRSSVSVFFQIWDRPLMTLNNYHVVSDVIRLCGGQNIFGDLTPLAPSVDLEAVLEGNPEVIIASAKEGQRPLWLDEWLRWAELHATKQGNLFYVHADLINRHGPRLLDGAEVLCEQLEQVRLKRGRDTLE